MMNRIKRTVVLAICMCGIFAGIANANVTADAFPVDYTIVSSGLICRLPVKVMELMQKGWFPYGPVFVYDNAIHQVMVVYTYFENEE